MFEINKRNSFVNGEGNITAAEAVCIYEVRYVKVESENFTEEELSLFDSMPDYLKAKSSKAVTSINESMAETLNKPSIWYEDFLDEADTSCWSACDIYADVYSGGDCLDF